MPILGSLASGSSRGFNPGGGGSLYAFTTATFTSGTTTGQDGPSLATARGGLTGPETSVWKTNTDWYNTTAGIQLWTVPSSGTYRIETWGAQGGGGGYSGGYGSRMRGDFSLVGGTVIKILVGQAGGPSYGGGGGGTFVAKSDNTPLIVSGGGNCTSPWSSSIVHAVVSTSGTSSSTGVAGGTNGQGGASNNAGSCGGGGFYGDGATVSCSGSVNPKAFVNGGRGGNTCNAIGGFGGGAGSDGCCQGTSGAGGGYSGGAGTSSTWPGAGGSYNAGANQSNNNGNETSAQLTIGQVTITKL